MGKCLGTAFNTWRGVTKGDPLLPTIFNIVVDTVVRSDLLEVCGPKESQNGFLWAAGEHDICFYANDK